MTTPADDTAVEDAFEALLAGRPVPEEAADLAVFTEAVRTTATAPGRPNAALAELLATGLLTDQSSPSARTARSAGASPSRGTRTRNRRRFAMIFPALLAKLLSAGAVAQAATGAGIVVVVATGAGATGLLGEDVKDGISSVVAPADEVTAQDETQDDTAPEADETLDTDPTAVGADGETSVSVEQVDTEFVAETWAAGPQGYKNFGAWVSAGAHHKAEVAEYLATTDVSVRNFGELVRAKASANGLGHRELEEELEKVGVELEEPIQSTTDDAPDGTDGDADQEVAPTQSGQGNGKANGNGGGNGGSNGKGNGRN